MSSLSLPSSQASFSQSMNIVNKVAAASAPTVTCSGVSIIDKRVRISMMPGSPAIFYKDKSNTLLAPLALTSGVLFPYQPTVPISFSASYQDQKVTHSDFTFHSYENSELKPIDLSCDFPVRTPTEGIYVFAALHFLRCLTFMFTGTDGPPYAGSPPLVVSLSGMGFGGLDNIPIVVTNVTTTYPDNIDYVSVAIPGLNGEIAKIPTLMTIAISVTPMFSRAFASTFGTLNFSKGLANARLLGPNPTSSIPAGSTTSTTASSTSATNSTGSPISTTSIGATSNNPSFSQSPSANFPGPGPLSTQSLQTNTSLA